MQNNKISNFLILERLALVEEAVFPLISLLPHTSAPSS